ncbi:Nif11-like leader peptide family natural product precursor [Francisella uliginis]|uniref:Nif11 domain-containing protein n=1 Tax=Francisella uliginis TaxID=573570 RepID=A0A1L4BUL4_9GAMM|nr:Nif11-like leader peptide family natural product precursor [Francisella uliginis]API87526.1 hypothetical protein F7310_09240 [Francisella uliginis]
MENIKHYPKSYMMSEELKRFFTKVTNDTDLQKQLYNTKTLAEVANIAIELGFKIRPAEIIQAQAGRILAILDQQPEDVVYLLSSKKAKTGAQWGRGGNGFLDNPGYWLMKLASTNAITENEVLINSFLKKAHKITELEIKLYETKSFNSLENLMHEYGFDISAKKLLSHQAQKILALNADDADKVAAN